MTKEESISILSKCFEHMNSMSDDELSDYLENNSETFRDFVNSFNKKVKVRFAGSMMSLSESVEKCFEVSSLEELKEIAKKDFPERDLDTMTIEYYCYDDRIDWNTWIVCSDYKNGKYKHQAMYFVNGELK